MLRSYLSDLGGYVEEEYASRAPTKNTLAVKVVYLHIPLTPFAFYSVPLAPTQKSWVHHLPECLRCSAIVDSANLSNNLKW